MNFAAAKTNSIQKVQLYFEIWLGKCPVLSAYKRSYVKCPATALHEFEIKTTFFCSIFLLLLQKIRTDFSSVFLLLTCFFLNNVLSF